MLNIPFSKTDQTGRGDVVYISPTTIAALDEMCDKKQEQGIEATDNLILQMTTKQLRRQIRTACEALGLQGKYNAKSPRIGMSMDLASAGCSSNDLMKAGRFRTWAIPDRLTRNHPGMAGTGPLVSRYQAQQKDSASE